MCSDVSGPQGPSFFHHAKIVATSQVKPHEQEAVTRAFAYLQAQQSVTPMNERVVEVMQKEGVSTASIRHVKTCLRSLESQEWLHGIVDTLAVAEHDALPEDVRVKIVPQPTGGGVNESWFLYSASYNGKPLGEAADLASIQARDVVVTPVAVFKPTEGQRVDVRYGIPPDECALRDCFASIMCETQGSQMRIPYTQLASFSSATFADEKLTNCPNRVKDGSLQRFIAGAKPLTDFNQDERNEIRGKMSKKDKDFLACTDVLLGNTDRHMGNLLYHEEEGVFYLIDNSYTLSQGYRDQVAFCWYDWPGMERPLDPEVREWALSLDFTKEYECIQKLHPEECLSDSVQKALRVKQANYILLQESVKRDMSPVDFGAGVMTRGADSYSNHALSSLVEEAYLCADEDDFESSFRSEIGTRLDVRQEEGMRSICKYAERDVKKLVELVRKGGEDIASFLNCDRETIVCYLLTRGDTIPVIAKAVWSALKRFDAQQIFSDAPLSEYIREDLQGADIVKELSEMKQVSMDEGDMEREAIKAEVRAKTEAKGINPNSPHYKKVVNKFFEGKEI